MLFGGIALVVVIVLGVVLYCSFSSGGTSCVPVKEKPDVAKEAKIVTSTGNNALANFAGYLELAKDQYLPVELDSMEVVEPKEGKPGSVKLAGKCVTVSFEYSVKEDQNKKSIYSYNAIKMMVKNDAKKEDFKEVCSFTTPFSFDQPADLRYSCKSEQTHKCTKTSDKEEEKVNANLVLKSFEVELGDKPDDIKNGAFAKKEFPESCTKWSS